MTHRRDDLIYTAALIDGEGSVLLQRSAPNEHRRPAVTIPSTTYVFMTFLKTTFGGNVSSKKASTPQASLSWNWSVRGNAALLFLKTVIKFMKEPEKVRRARLLLDRYKDVTSRNGQYSKQRFLEKERFEREFFSTSKKVRSYEAVRHDIGPD